MIHPKYDSDIASSDPSSPRSPKQPIYYVQSPSRDSQDCDKFSIQTTLICDSAPYSPSHSSFRNHSRISSASRFSGTFRSCSYRNWNKRGNDRGWPECNVIQEEGSDDDLEERGFSRHCKTFIALMVFFILFIAVFLIIFCSASSPYRAKIVVEILDINNFILAAGSDYTGVPTKMATVNGSIMMSVYNPAPLFGIHVSSTPINLFYLEIPIATGELKEYYQPRKSHQNVHVVIQGAQVPLYGAGEALSMSTSRKSVPLRLEFTIRSQGDIVGKLIGTRHHKHISCMAVIDPDKTIPINVSQESCTYD